MPRYIFSPAAVDTGGRPARVTFYLTATARNPLIDLYRVDGNDIPIDAVPNGILIASASTGLTGTFAGPDDIGTLWLQVNERTGERVETTAARSSSGQPSGGGDVPSNRTISVGPGLTGGGSLAADRTISLSFGSGSGTVTQGNDARLSDARTPTAHAASHVAAGSDPLTLAQTQVTNLTSNLASKADLVGGKVPSSQLPSITTGGQTFVVASQAAQVALSTAIVGDIAVRTDQNKSYILGTVPYSTFGNWVELIGTGAITSVNSQTGSVVLSATDVGAAPSTRTITAGTGLTGGGDLSANRTLTLDIGTGASQAAAGNHVHSAASITSGTLSNSRIGVLDIANAVAGTNVTVFKSGGTWPARPTSRTDIVVVWSGLDPSPAIVSSGTGGMLDNVDKREIPAA